MEMDSLWTEYSPSVICLPCFSRFCSAGSESCTALSKSHCLYYRLRCVCMWFEVPVSVWMVSPQCCLAVCLCMDVWMDGEERELVDLSAYWLLSFCIHLSFPLFSRSISSPPTCSHIECGINPSHFHYLSLSISAALSLPLHSGHSVPIEYTCCRHKWACVSSVPQQSYHILIRSFLVAGLILLHPLPLCNWARTSSHLSPGDSIQMLQFILYCRTVY